MRPFPLAPPTQMLKALWLLADFSGALQVVWAQTCEQVSVSSLTPLPAAAPSPSPVSALTCHIQHQAP